MDVCDNRPGQREPRVIDIRQYYVAGTGKAADGGGHDPNRPGACNKDVFAKNVESERRMDGIAQWIEDGAKVVGN